MSLEMIRKPLRGGGELSKEPARESEMVGRSNKEGATRIGNGSLDEGVSLKTYLALSNT